jgi:signal peptidase II
MRSYIPLGLWVALGGMILDQASKVLIANYFSQGNPPFDVFSLLEITLVYNRGISFGFLAQDSFKGIVFLCLLALSITGLMIHWLRKSTTVLEASGLGLIIGGAIGNVIDRLRLGAVIDFIHCHWQNFSFPAFNFADSWITLGAILILYEQLLHKEEKNHVKSQKS